MIRIRTLLPIAAAATQFALPALAQQANSLPELLDQVQKVRAEQNAMFEKNRAEYENAPEAQQAALMQKAEKQRADLDASSKKLADTYSANEVQINNLNQQLRDALDIVGADRAVLSPQRRGDGLLVEHAAPWPGSIMERLYARTLGRAND